jgi:hypothetical protein
MERETIQNNNQSLRLFSHNGFGNNYHPAAAATATATVIADIAMISKENWDSSCQVFLNIDVLVRRSSIVGISGLSWSDRRHIATAETKM